MARANGEAVPQPINQGGPKENASGFGRAEGTTSLAQEDRAFRTATVSRPSSPAATHSAHRQRETWRRATGWAGHTGRAGKYRRVLARRPRRTTLSSTVVDADGSWARGTRIRLGNPAARTSSAHSGPCGRRGPL